MDDKISVIIPVYNVEKYLRECVDSVLAQTYTNLEIMLIDDGSTDSSGEICDEYAGKDGRIRVIHQKNGGVSTARNYGIEHSSGDYLIFMDSDDIMHPQYVQMMLEAAQKTGCQMVVCDFQRFQNTSELWTAAQSIEEQVLTQEEALSLLNIPIGDSEMSMAICCCKLYHHCVLRSVRFPTGIRHEDEFFAHRVLCEVPSVCRLRYVLYGYRQHSGSFMAHQQGKEGYYSHLPNLQAMQERIEIFAVRYPQLVSGAMRHLLYDTNDMYNILRGQHFSGYKAEQKELSSFFRRIYEHNFKYLGLKQKLSGALFSYTPWIYNRLCLIMYYMKELKKKR